MWYTKRDRLAPAHHLPVYRFKIRKCRSIVEIWQARRADDPIDFHLRFPLHLRVLNHQVEKRRDDGYCLPHFVWVADFAYISAKHEPSQWPLNGRVNFEKIARWEVYMQHTRIGRERNILHCLLFLRVLACFWVRCIVFLYEIRHKRRVSSSAFLCKIVVRFSSSMTKVEPKTHNRSFCKIQHWVLHVLQQTSSFSSNLEWCHGSREPRWNVGKEWEKIDDGFIGCEQTTGQKKRAVGGDDHRIVHGFYLISVHDRHCERHRQPAHGKHY